MPYVIHSLDASKFQQLFERPTPEQLTQMATVLAEVIQDNVDELDEDDPIRNWGQGEPLESVIATRLPRPDWYGDLSPWGQAIWEQFVVIVCDGHDAFDLGGEMESDGVSWSVIDKPAKHLHKKATSPVALKSFGKRPWRCLTAPEDSDDDDDSDETMQQLKEYLDDLQTRYDEYEDLTISELEAKIAAETKLPKRMQKLIVSVFAEEMGLEYDDNEEETAWIPTHSMHPPQEVQQILDELKSVEGALKKRDDLWDEYEEELKPALEGIVAQGRMLFVVSDT